MKVVIITGTPGTGKTSLAKFLAQALNFKRLSLNQLVDRQKLCEAYDKKNRCRLVDLKKLIPLLIDIIKESKESLIIDSHLSHKIPKEYVDLCLVTKTDLKVLHQRLEKRRYPKQKIRDNLDAEIFDLCLTEAQEAGHKVMIVDTTRKIDKEALVQKVKERLKIR